MEKSYNNLTLHKHSQASVIFESFPNIVGTFTPTVRITLVNAVPTLRITKDPSFTHKNANISIYARL
jgi:hypothetical protein